MRMKCSIEVDNEFHKIMKNRYNIAQLMVEPPNATIYI